MDFFFLHVQFLDPTQIQPRYKAIICSPNIKQNKKKVWHIENAGRKNNEEKKKETNWK